MAVEETTNGLKFINRNRALGKQAERLLELLSGWRHEKYFCSTSSGMSDAGVTELEWQKNGPLKVGHS